MKNYLKIVPEFIAKYMFWLLTKIKWLVVVFWIAAALISAYFAFCFLNSTSLSTTPPSSSLAAEANEIVLEKFPVQGTFTPTAVVISNTTDQPLLSDWVEGLEHYISDSLTNSTDADQILFTMGYYLLPDADSFIKDIMSQFVQYAIVSDDTTVVPVFFKTNDVNVKLRIIKSIREYIEEYNETNPNSNYFVGVTGFDAMSIDLQTSIKKSIELVDMVVFPVAFIILYAAFQSPVLLIVPFINILVIIPVSFGLMYPVTFFKDIYGIAPAIMTAAIGAMGIDYSVFMLTRFSEEHTNKKSYKECVRISLFSAGKIIVTSATIILFCFLAVCLFPVDIIKYVGVSCVVAVFISMFVNLTLTPSLLLCFPFLFKHLGLIPFNKYLENFFNKTYNHTASVWHQFCELQSRTSMSIVLLAIGCICMVPFVIGIKNFYYTADTNHIFPRNTEFTYAYENLQRTFPPGIIFPQSIVIQDNNGTLNPWKEEYYNFTLDFVDLLKNELQHTFPAKGLVCFNTAVGQVFEPSTLRKIKRIDLYQNISKVFLSEDETTVKCFLIPGVDLSYNSTDILHELRDKLQVIADKYNYNILAQSVNIDLLDCVDYSMDRITLILLVLLAIVVGLTLLFFGYISVPIRVIFTTTVTLLIMICFCFVELKNLDKKGYSTKLSILRGVEKSGYLITSCGLLMICSFCGLFLSNVFVLNTFAFVLSFAVFIDTFIIRVLIVPCMLYLLHELNWWPIKYKTLHVDYSEYDVDNTSLPSVEDSYTPVETDTQPLLQ
ncbi:Membrane transport protein MMPL domain-containing protein [Entamoeba marina]